MDVDNLNFKVIIDDSQFNKKIETMKKTAKEFNVSLSSILNIQSLSQELVVNNRKRNQMETDNIRALERQNREKMRTQALERELNARVEKTTNSYKQQSRLLNEIKGYALGYLSIHGASQFLSSLIRITGQFELQKTTLGAMLGDLNKAESIISQIKGLAIESPFRFTELSTYAKQLAAFSVPAQEIYDTTKMLADVSAGLGVDMNRIVLAYGQVRSAAFLRGQEVRQFTEAGIPILDELAKQFTELEGRAVSTGEVFDKISARLVPFEMVAKVLKDMTSEGGKFFQMQEIQSATLSGKWENLKDVIEQTINAIGESQSENLKGVIDSTRRLVQNYEDIGKSLVSLTVTYGSYKAAILAAEIMTGRFNLANHKLINSLATLGKSMLTNPYVVLAAGLAATIGLTIKAVTTQTRYEKALKLTNKTAQEFNSNVASESSALDYLLKRLEKLKVGTEEYNEVKSQILKDYNQYLTDIDRENLAVGNLAGMYDKLKKSIVDVNREKALNEGSAGITQMFTTEYDKIFAKFDETIKTAGINDKGTRIALADYIRGAIGFEDLPQEIQDNVNKAISQVKSMENGGIGGSQKSLSWFDFTLLRQQIADLDEITTEARNRLSEDLRVIYGPLPAPKKTEQELSDFVKTVQETLGKFGATKDNKGKFSSLWAESTTEYYGYIDDLRKGYIDIQQRIKDVGLTQKANLPDLEKQKEAYEAIATALGITLEEASAINGKPVEQNAIEQQIKSIQKLKDAYEKLMPYLDEMQMKSTLKDLFPNIGVGIIDSLDFNAELEKLADKLQEFDEDAAQRLRDSVSKDIAGSIAESFKVVEQYKKMLDSWMGEDFDIMGEGTAFDISKILTNLNTEYSKIDQKRKNALDLLNKAQIGDEIALAKVREVYGEEVWEKYLAKGEQVINELATKEAAAARQVANEKIRDLADKDLKERMEKANINLSDFDDKTIAQVDEAYTRLFVLRNQLHNELEMLKANGVAESEEANVQRLEEELKNLDVIIDDTGVELEKKVYDRAKSCMQAISGLGSSISKLGSAMGNTGISRFGEELSRTADFASNLMEAFKAKDTIALIANVATYVIETVANVASYAYERQQALNDAAREYSEIMNQTRRDSYSGIYGTDEMGLAIENQRILAEEQEKYQETLAKAEKVKWQRFSGGNYRTQSVIDELENAAITEGWELYRKSGELNIEALEAYFDVYRSRFSKKQRDLISELIENGKALDDAAAQQAEYLTSLFGNVADNISSSMIEAFLTSGDAAIDMRNMVSDIAKEMVADLIKTMYIMPILDSYRDKFAQIDSNMALNPSEKAEAQLSLLETALGEISSQSGVISDTIERFEDYLGEGTETGTEIGQGIKGITEDQANLLASYLNAIRADVSFSKTLWVKMDANLQKIADMLTSSPTLMEYQAQIAANTYDTALASQEILSQLRSVITTDSGDSAIRVNS